MPSAKDTALLPDAGPLITRAYADALDVLFKPGWTVMLVDMVLHEVTRNQTPTSSKLAAWAASARIPVLPTKMMVQNRLPPTVKADRTRKPFSTEKLFSRASSGGTSPQSPHTCRRIKASGCVQVWTKCSNTAGVATI
jgi:hypothetical protein